jgi:glycosyltransferase involved in cell wall biosynthesis
MGRSVMAVADCAHDECLEEVVWRRVAPLAAHGTGVDVLLVRCSPALRARLAAQGMRLTQADVNGAPDWASIRDLAVLARSARATVLYAHGEYAHMLCALTGPLLGVPVVAHLLRSVSLIDAHACSLCRSTVIVATEYARSQALAIGCSDVVAIATPASRECIRRESLAGTRTIGWAGDWHDDYDPELFIRAAARLADDGARVGFRMSVPAGAIAMSEPLPARLAARLSFVPLRFGRRGFTEGLDIYVHTASHDATHVLLADALAAGLPVLATTANGSGDFVAAASDVRLYQPGDEDALVAALAAACRADNARGTPLHHGEIAAPIIVAATPEDAAARVDALLHDRLAITRA